MQDETLAKAAMYAIRAVVDGLRDSGVLTQAAVEAIEARTTTGLNMAAAIKIAGVGLDADETQAIRHGMWWARECIAPTGGTMPTLIEHSNDPYDWPSLAQRQAGDEE